MAQNCNHGVPSKKITHSSDNNHLLASLPQEGNPVGLYNYSSVGWGSRIHELSFCRGGGKTTPTSNLIWHETT